MYLCTWYSEGLLRRRSEGEPGWGSGEDTGYTPRARWYLKNRTERRLHPLLKYSVSGCTDLLSNPPKTSEQFSFSLVFTLTYSFPDASKVLAYSAKPSDYSFALHGSKHHVVYNQFSWFCKAYRWWWGWGRRCPGRPGWHSARRRLRMRWRGRTRCRWRPAARSELWPAPRSLH